VIELPGSNFGRTVAPTMNLIPEVEALKEQYQQDALSQEDYFDQIVQGIRKDPSFRDFLGCVYEELYDEEEQSSRIGAYTNEELWEAIELLKSSCVNWNDSAIPSYLELLKDYIGEAGYGLLIRWALSKLVGMAMAERQNSVA
jgi:hypothetical protein